MTSSVYQFSVMSPVRKFPTQNSLAMVFRRSFSAAVIQRIIALPGSYRIAITGPSTNTAAARRAYRHIPQALALTIWRRRWNERLLRAMSELWMDAGRQRATVTQAVAFPEVPLLFRAVSAIAVQSTVLRTHWAQTPPCTLIKPIEQPPYTAVNWLSETVRYF